MFCPWRRCLNSRKRPDHDPAGSHESVDDRWALTLGSIPLPSLDLPLTICLHQIYTIHHKKCHVIARNFTTLLYSNPAKKKKNNTLTGSSIDIRKKRQAWSPCGGRSGITSLELGGWSWKNPIAGWDFFGGSNHGLNQPSLRDFYMKNVRPIFVGWFLVDWDNLSYKWMIKWMIDRATSPWVGNLQVSHGRSRNKILRSLGDSRY